MQKKKLTLWSAGAVDRMSFINTGIRSVTLFTPAAYVPSGAELLMAWPCCLAWSSHLRVTESTTYSTPSLCVPGVFLKCVNNFWTRTVSDCEAGKGEVKESAMGCVSGSQRYRHRAGLTWTLATQRAVSELMREPDTPGGLRPCMACRPASSSATGDAIVPCDCVCVCRGVVMWSDERLDADAVMPRPCLQVCLIDSREYAASG